MSYSIMTNMLFWFMKLTFILLSLNFMMIMMILSQKLISMGAILFNSAGGISVLSTFMFNSWYAFILFLIYITGLLVLFGYFLALTPNLYQSKKKCIKSYMLMFIPLASTPSLCVINFPTYKMAYEMDVLSLMSGYNMPIYWFMVITLLLLLLMVVSLTFKSPSPLRNYLS